MLVFLLGLQWPLLIGCFGAEIDYDSDIIVNMTLIFASQSRASCIKFLHGEQDHRVFQIYKRLSSYPYKMAGAYSYEDYLEPLKHGTSQKSCFKPLELVLEGKGSKEKFTALSRTLPMGGVFWLLILKTPISDFLSDAKLPFNIEMVVAEIKSRDLVEFREVYRVDDEYPLRIVKYGKWTRSNGPELPKTQLYERRSDLEGKVLRAGSIENWPLSTFKMEEWDGYFPRIWKELENLINSTTKPFRAIDNSTGSKKANGTWNGLVGMILRDEIDVIVSEISINEERSTVLKLSRPVLISKYQIYFASQGNFLRWLTVFQPLSSKIWLTVTAWIAIATFSITFCYHLSWTIGMDINTRKILNFTESFFFVLQSLCQQGYSETPKSTACRIILLLCFIVSSILIPSYSAAIISSLTHEILKKPFDSVQEMLDDNTYKLIVLPNTGQFAYFKNSRDALHAMVFRKLILTVPKELEIKTISDVLHKVFCKLNKYAFFTIEKIFQMRLEYDPIHCSLISISEELAPVYQSLAFVKGSPFIGLIDYHLQRLYERGIINRIQRSIRKNHHYLFNPVFHEVQAEDTFEVFIIFSLGLIMSIILLLVEKMHSKRLYSISLFLRKRYFHFLKNKA